MATGLLFTADAVGDPEPITIQAVSGRVRVRQNDLSGSPGPFNVRAPLKTSAAVRYEGGMEVSFEASIGSFFHPGDVPGYIEMITGSDQFLQMEDR